MFSSTARKDTPIYIHREISGSSNTWFSSSDKALDYFNPGVAIDAKLYGVDRSIRYSKFSKDVNKGVVFYVMGSHFSGYPESYLLKFTSELNPDCRVLVVTSEIKSDATETTDLDVVDNFFTDPSLRQLPIVKFQLPQNSPELSAEKARDQKIGIFGALTRLGAVKRIMTSSVRRRASASLGFYKNEGADVVAGKELPKGGGMRASISAGGQIFAEDLALTPEEEAQLKAAADSAKRQATMAKGAKVTKPVKVEQSGRDTMSGGWEGWNSFVSPDDDSVQTKTLTDEQVQAYADACVVEEGVTSSDFEEEKAEQKPKASGRIFGRLFGDKPVEKAPAAKAPEYK